MFAFQIRSENEVPEHFNQISYIFRPVQGHFATPEAYNVQAGVDWQYVSWKYIPAQLVRLEAIFPRNCLLAVENREGAKKDHDLIYLPD